MKVVALSWRDLAHQSAGGAEVLVDRVLSGLSARGHDVTLVCGGPPSEHEFQVVDAGGTYSQYARVPLICVSRFRHADVIVDTQNGMPYFSPLWWRRPSVCLVHHVHTDQWQERFSRPVASLCRAVERDVMPVVYRNRPFVATSRSTADAMRDIGIRETSITIIESGVDAPSEVTPERSEEPLFVSLNRLVPHKRISLLLRAWERAGDAIKGRLVIAGDGPLLDELRRQASRMRGVEVLGRVSEEDKNDLLARAWAIVSTTHHEGWGMSIMEAAAVGTPALALDVPGICDSVVDGVTGVLVRANGELEIPEAFAKAMVTFARDEGRRRALGAGARRRALEYSWDRSVRQWEVVLEAAAVGHGTHGRRRTGNAAASASLEVTSGR